MYASSNLGRLAAREGRYSEALAVFEEARAEYERLDIKPEVIETDARIAECLALQGDAAGALAAAERALEAAIAGGSAMAQVPLLHRVRGWALELQCVFQQARAAYDESLEAARQRNALFDIALALNAIAGLGTRTGNADEEARAEGEGLLRLLDVERVFEPRFP